MSGASVPISIDVAERFSWTREKHIARVIMALEYWLTPHLRAPKAVAVPATNGAAA